MVSITSVISLFILLLATYSYSAPIQSENDYTTGATMVDHGHPANLQLVEGKESASVPNLEKERVFAKLEDEESSTPGAFTHSPRQLNEFSEESSTPGAFTHSRRQSNEYRAESRTPCTFTHSRRQSNEFRAESPTFGDVTRSPCTHESISFPSSPVKDNLQDKRQFYVKLSSTTESPSETKREFDEYESSTMESGKREFDEYGSSTMESEKRDFDEYGSSTVEPVQRSLFEYSTSAMETATSFNQRAVSQDEVPETFEVSTPFSTEEQPETVEVSTPVSTEEQPEIEKNVEPSSSVDSFAKSTDLLQPQETTEEQPGSSDTNSELKPTVNFQPGQVRQTKTQSSKSKSSKSKSSAESTDLLQPQETTEEQPEFSNTKSELKPTAKFQPAKVHQTKIYSSKSSKSESESSSSNSESSVQYYGQPSGSSRLF
jgi:hypothetical protein